MKVIFTDNVKGIGRIGDVKEVNDGYARNFLLPRKLAKAASDGAVKDAQTWKSKKLEAASLEHAQAQQLADKLRGTTVAMFGRANEKGTLFSGIPRAAVAEKVSEVAGARITPDRITSDDHLKHLGPHTIHVKFAEDVSAEMTIDIQLQS